MGSWFTVSTAATEQAADTAITAPIVYDDETLENSDFNDWNVIRNSRVITHPQSEWNTARIAKVDIGVAI